MLFCLFTTKSLKKLLIPILIFGFITTGYYTFQKIKISTRVQSPIGCLPKLILPQKEKNDYYEFPKWYQNYSKSQINFLNENVFVFAKTPDDARKVFFKETECGNFEFVKALYGPSISPSEPAEGHDRHFDNYWTKFGNRKFENIMPDTDEQHCSEQTRVTVEILSFQFCVDPISIDGNQFYTVSKMFY
jgi:hypothetical protein